MSPLLSIASTSLRIHACNDLVWSRDGTVMGVYSLGSTPVERGENLRTTLTSISGSLLATDDLTFIGEYDFGTYYAIYLPACNYHGYGAHFRHDMQIDGQHALGLPEVHTKNGSTPGICLSAGVTHFSGFTFTFTVNGESPATEDGGGIGWSGSDNYNGYSDLLSQVGEVHFHECTFHSEDCDWMIFSWGGGGYKQIHLSFCEVYYSRFAVACCFSGGLTQSVLISDSNFYGVVDGSHATGYTGSLDPVDGAVMAAVVNRGGETDIVNCTFSSIGMVAPWDFGTNGCERIATIFTDQYSGSAQVGSVSILNSSTSCTPNASDIYNDIDMRYGTVTDLGSNVGIGVSGALKLYTP